jgi:ATP-dependent Clp protease ATP-binding subunit ClpA
MHYSINLSEESEHLLRQLCDPGPNSHSEAISVEDFLSALVEEHLDELFVRRERRKTEKDKKLNGAVRSAKERAKAWSDAAIATQTALEAMRKLVSDEATNPKVDRGFGRKTRKQKGHG